MSALSTIAAKGHFAFLASLLELSHADWDVEFVGLRIENHITEWSEIRHTPRETKYASEQKARRSRIAFGELLSYFAKPNRNAFIVETHKSIELLDLALEQLEEVRKDTDAFDVAIKGALASDASEVDEKFRAIYLAFSDFDFGIFAKTRETLQAHMDEVGENIASMWDDDRFTRQGPME